MRTVILTAVSGFAVFAALVSAHAAGGAISGPVANSPASQASTANPDTATPQATKPSVGTSDTATGAASPAPPGTDTSTAAPGGQAESTKNGALGTTMGGNVVHRHHGPKRPTQKPDRPTDGGPAGSPAPQDPPSK